MYDLIFVSRLNNAPVPGFERDAGSRTTIRLIYPEGAPHSANEYKETNMVALVVFKSLDLDWLTSVITKQPLVDLHHSKQNWHITIILVARALSHYHTHQWYISHLGRASGPKCGSGGKWWMIFPWDQRASESSTQRLYARQDKSYRHILLNQERCRWQAFSRISAYRLYNGMYNTMKQDSRAFSPHN